MTQQEHEAYVRARWAQVSAMPYMNAPDHLCVIVGGVRFVNSVRGSSEAWQAVFDFTVAREEEIRQLGDEIEQMKDLAGMKRGDIDCEIDTAEGYDPSWNDEALVTYVRDLCEYSRTLARLQRDLAVLLKGWREQEANEYPR
jgi:hypothetical protein